MASEISKSHGILKQIRCDGLSHYGMSLDTASPTSGLDKRGVVCCSPRAGIYLNFLNS